MHLCVHVANKLRILCPQVILTLPVQIRHIHRSQRYLKEEWRSRPYRENQVALLKLHLLLEQADPEKVQPGFLQQVSDHFQLGKFHWEKCQWPERPSLLWHLWTRSWWLRVLLPPPHCLRLALLLLKGCCWPFPEEKKQTKKQPPLRKEMQNYLVLYFKQENTIVCLLHRAYIERGNYFFSLPWILKTENVFVQECQGIIPSLLPLLPLVRLNLLYTLLH